MRGSRSIRLNDINEGSCGICCECRRISPLNVRIASRGNANIAISEHGRSSFTISGRILVNRFLRSIYGSVRRIAPVNCELLEVAESRFEPVMSAGSAKP